MTTEATRLKRLHDNLRTALEDWDGHFHNEDWCAISAATGCPTLATCTNKEDAATSTGKRFTNRSQPND